MTESGPTSVFVISPIGKPGTDVYKHAMNALTYIIRKALPPPKWNVVRADEEASPDSIGQRVIDRILTSDLVVADLTGHNPNVFYELAVAHSFKRPVVLMNGDDRPLPFDITDQRAIFYTLSDPGSVDNAKEALAMAAIKALEAPDKLVTPLTQYEAVQTTTARVAGGDQSALAEVLESISSRLAALERESHRWVGSVEELWLTLTQDRREFDLALPDDRTNLSISQHRNELRALESEIERLNAMLHGITAGGSGSDDEKRDLQDARSHREMLMRRRDELVSRLSSR